MAETMSGMGHNGTWNTFALKILLPGIFETIGNSGDLFLNGTLVP